MAFSKARPMGARLAAKRLELELGPPMGRKWELVRVCLKEM